MLQQSRFIDKLYLKMHVFHILLFILLLTILYKNYCKHHSDNCQCRQYYDDLVIKFHNYCHRKYVLFECKVHSNMISIKERLSYAYPLFHQCSLIQLTVNLHRLSIPPQCWFRTALLRRRSRKKLWLYPTKKKELKFAMYNFVTTLRIIFTIALTPDTTSNRGSNWNESNCNV